MKEKINSYSMKIELGILYVLLALIPSIQIIAVANFIDKVTLSFNGSASKDEVYIACVYIFLCLLGNLVFSELIKLSKIYYIQKYDIKIKDKILSKRSRLKYKYIEDKDICDDIQVIEDEPANKLLNVVTSILEIINIIIRIVGFVAIIIMQLWWIGLIVLFVVGIVTLISYKSGQIKYDAYEESAKYNRRAKYLQKVLSSRDHAQERKLFGFFDKVNLMWKNQYEKMRNVEYNANVKVFLQLGFSEGIANLLILILGVILLYPLSVGNMSVGIYISLISGSFKIVDIITRELSSNIENLTENMVFYNKLKSFLQLEEIDDIPFNNFTLTKFKTIEMKDVTFTYPKTEKLILNKLNLKFDFGKRYALVGANGSGKSTIVKLLLGLYEDYEGEILIDGVDIRKFSKKDLVNFEHAVLQDFSRYSISIKDYICLGTTKNILEKDILEVLEKVGMRKKVDELNFGINTNLGKLDEDAVDLSGGQWQRIEIARSLINDKAFTILDEPTSAIDPISEMKLYKLFSKAIKDRTSLIITHRLGAARIADEILLLKDGVIKEQGTHDELMNLHGVYYEMFDAQRSWYDEEK
ncbi:ABC transporter ATP-binding protein [Sedimentibacter sp. zth1]|uniref:ABC transporter ATP-binding protein n=1 Tax=Sedimentibacter sp. zth1 TaxID=2816908 RepID=UPI001A9158D5|nr:ABC transporter ATP-binding protein [Sedimentibacter sp. zth1]QSX05874.1 ABC transporter ATP-binding protein [Sedimentibacter sp. zth1]